MGYRTWPVVAGLVAGALLAASGVEGAAERKGGTLRISSVADLDSVDPALGYTDTSWWVEYATCARLYNNPGKSGAEGATVVPEVAARFPRVSRDGRTQTVELKRTFRFHTGAPITAANFVAAFNRDASARLHSPAVSAGYLSEIAGADAVIRGRAKRISGVRALNPYTLQIRTTRPLHDLPARLTLPFFCPIATDTPIREIDDPLGSGPYYVATRIRNRRIVLERNPNYRGSRPANVDRVVWSMGSGQEACLQGVERNTIDYCLGWARGYGPGAEREIAAKYGINRRNGRFFSNPLPQTFYFAFNHDRPAFRGTGQIPLKQAINWALDRSALVRAAGFGKPTDQILPPALTRAASIYPLGPVTPGNLTKARELLAKARVTPEKLVLYAPSEFLFPAWARIFQRDLKRLGIDVVVKYFAFETLAKRAGARGEPFDVAVTAWSADYADPITFFDPLLSGHNLAPKGNQNYAYFDRARYNREIDRIDRLSGAARRRPWADLDVEMMRNDPPWAPVMNGVQRDFVSRSFGCYVFQPVIGHLDLAAACKK